MKSRWGWWAVVAIGLTIVVMGYASWRRYPEPLPTGLPVATPTAAPSATPGSTSTPLAPSATATPAPTSTSTRRPVDTFTPTRTPTATRTPTMTPTPPPIETPVLVPLPVITTTPVMTSPLPQPTQMPLIVQPEDAINILLLGMDRKSGAGVARTDVIMIASLFPESGSVSLISFPRDYYAWIPSWGLDKINTAYLRASTTKYPGGGPALIRDTVTYNFGLPIHYYAMVDFDSYRTIVNAVGGVDIAVECPLHDTFPDEESDTGQTDIDFDPGVYHMDGKVALWYVRSRWNTSDFDRHRRQQQVLRAIFDQGMQQNLLLRAPELWDLYRTSLETDMDLIDILALAPMADGLEPAMIKQRFLRGKDLLSPYTAPNGGAVQVPNYETLMDFMQEAAQPPLTNRAAQRAYRVAVVNSSGRPGLGAVAAYRLGLEGFEVLSVEEGGWLARTTLTDYTTTSKGSPLATLLRIYSLPVSDLLRVPTEGSAVDFKVELGSNYDSCRATTLSLWQSTPTPTPTKTPMP